MFLVICTISKPIVDSFAAMKSSKLVVASSYQKIPLQVKDYIQYIALSLRDAAYVLVLLVYR